MMMMIFTFLTYIREKFDVLVESIITYLSDILDTTLR